MNNYVIEVKNITKYFSKHIILNNLSFNVKESEKVAIFAPSGSGKTTLLNILSGLDLLYEGSYSINKPFSIVFQESRLFPYMTCYENIIFPFKIKNINITEKINKNIEDWLYITGLKGFEKYYPYQLSGGMKAKISIIRAFIIEPNIIFMDEPFKSIDIKSKQSIINFIKDNYNNLTLVLITHNIDELPLIGGKILKFSTTPLKDYEEIIIDKDSTITEILSKLYSN